MNVTLPTLPYPLDALAPVISREALDLHYGAHHQAYVDKLNDALAEHDWRNGSSIEDLVANLDALPPALREPVRRYGGGHVNHSLLWATMTPAPTPPSSRLEGLISRDFGSLVGLRLAFEQVAAGQFGSAWVFLAWNPRASSLELHGLPDQDSPLTLGLRPLCACDLWEHAYYVDYRNRRDDWVRDWWHLVDWRQVERRIDL